MKKLFFGLLLSSSLLACLPDEAFVLPTLETESKVEQDLQYYFDLFRTEAENRDVQIGFEFDEIEAHIIPIEEEEVAGQCSYRAGERTVTIDEDFWNRASSAYREWVVFHELGHCYLGRDHRDDETENGVCRSIMNSGLGDCRINYNRNTRKIYIDELFELR